MRAIAPGKLILSGEHAVVYGRPAIGMAIDRSAESIILPGGGEDEIVIDLSDGGQQEAFRVRALREFKKRVVKNYHLFLEGKLGIREVLRKPVELFQFAFITILDGLHLKLNDGFMVQMRSNIPIGCGLGSSAATVLSTLRAIGHYFRVDFRPEWYQAYSLEAENMQHGHASGVDTHLSLHGGCARFQEGAVQKIPLPRFPLYLVNTGAPLTTTGECVEHVRKEFAASAIWSEFEAVTRAMEAALLTNNLATIQHLIRENHRLLSEIGVVPAKVCSFISEIEELGAAAKICGAGASIGDNGGIVMVAARQAPHELAARYGYSLLPVRGDPLGVRVVA